MRTRDRVLAAIRGGASSVPQIVTAVGNADEYEIEHAVRQLRYLGFIEWSSGRGRAYTEDEMRENEEKRQAYIARVREAARADSDD